VKRGELSMLPKEFTDEELSLKPPEASKASMIESPKWL